MTSAPHVLLTGFPNSFLARRLLGTLLQRSETATVHCLVPERFMPDAEQAIAGMPAASSARVRLVLGDVSAMDLGMAGPQYLEFARKIDVVHHVPTATSPGVRPEVCEQVVLGGATEVLELAEAGGVERVVHWSSAMVSGRRTGHVLESELVRPPGFRTVVEEKLYRAERMMREAMDHVPVTVLRPSTIVGDSRTGEIDCMEGPYLLILLMLSSPVDLRVPLPGRGDTALHLVPIDFVADAGCQIADDPGASGRTFHIVDPNPPTARRVFELIAEEVGRPGPVGALPTQLATALLRTPGLERFSHIPRTFLEQLATPVEYDARNTEEVLAGTDIRCPSAPSYLRVMVDHVRKEQERRAKQRPRRSQRRRARPDETEDPLA